MISPDDNLVPNHCGGRAQDGNFGASLLFSVMKTRCAVGVQIYLNIRGINNNEQEQIGQLCFISRTDKPERECLWFVLSSPKCILKKSRGAENGLGMLTNMIPKLTSSAPLIDYDSHLLRVMA